MARIHETNNAAERFDRRHSRRHGKPAGRERVDPHYQGGATMKKGVIACSVAAIISLAAVLWPQSLRTSPEAQLKMAKYEDCRKTPYYCPAGVLTVGIGSTGKVQNREYAERRSPSAG
jgi:hypothetical protein